MELVEMLNKAALSDVPVVVEGIEDCKALTFFGFRNITVLSKWPLYQVVESIVKQSKSVIILTDLDKKGRELYAKLNHQFNQFGVHVDNELRHYLFRETQLRQIEGLVGYVERNG